jgi:hypothetical protein
MKCYSIASAMITIRSVKANPNYKIKDLIGENKSENTSFG